MTAPTKAVATIAITNAMIPARLDASCPTWWYKTVPPIPASAMVARLTSPAYPTSKTSDNAMMAAASASLNVSKGDAAMMRESMKTTITNTTPPTYAARIDGNVNRSRVRYATAPRSRS